MKARRLSSPVSSSVVAARRSAASSASFWIRAREADHPAQATTSRKTKATAASAK
jgi:hypothetical protein